MLSIQIYKVSFCNFFCFFFLFFKPSTTSGYRCIFIMLCTDCITSD